MINDQAPASRLDNYRPGVRLANGRWSLTLTACALTWLCFIASAQAQQERTASWKVPPAAEVKQQLDDWLAAQSPSEEQQQAVETLWSTTAETPTGEELREQLSATLAAVSPAAKEIVVFCQSPRSDVQLPAFEFLADAKQPAIVRNHLRLLYGVWLARHDMHEEALQQFAELSPANVVDPASLLFYRSVCHHRLRDKEACLPELA